jgi:hypothetical protein
MGEDVFEKPLVMKDFVKGRRKTAVKKSEKSKLYEKVSRLPESKIHKRQSKYLELVNAIAKEKKGTYKVLLNSIKEDLTPKSAYPSVEKALIQVAKRNGADFAIAVRRQVQTQKGIRTYVSYPEYIKWKEDNLRLKVVNGELFLEKRTDKPL